MNTFESLYDLLNDVYKEKTSKKQDDDNIIDVVLQPDGTYGVALGIE